MKRRIIALLTVLGLAFSGAAMLPEGVVSDLGSVFVAYAASSGKCGDNLTWKLNDEGTLTISGSGKMNDYYVQNFDNYIQTPWYNNTNIKKVLINNGVTSIGCYAFSMCTNITNITIPNSVTSIGMGAFYGCTSLKDITIPNSVTSIGGWAFSDCTNIKNITIPSSVTSIDEGAFYSCTSLKSITIPKSVKLIGKNAFNGCTDLKIKCYDTDVKIYAIANSIPYELIDDDTSSHKHSYTSKITKAATCSNTGTKTYTCSCGDSYTEVIPMTVHKYTSKVVKPTYDAQGYTLYTCSVCGDSYKDNFTLKLKRTSIAKATVSGLKNKYYTGMAITQSPVVKFGSKTLKAGTDYSISYKNNKAIGTATVTITGKGAYTGTAKATFKICPKKTTLKTVTSPKTKQLKATYSKVSGVTGYQITYSTSSKFTKATTKSVNASGTSKTISKLTKGKTYYVKVRTYKTVNGTKYYSGYSDVKKVKIK